MSLGKSVPDKVNNRYKCPRAETCLTYLRSRKEVTEAGVECLRESVEMRSERSQRPDW